MCCHLAITCYIRLRFEISLKYKKYTLAYKTSLLSASMWSIYPIMYSAIYVDMEKYILGT